MLTGRPDAVPGTNEAICPSVASIATKMCGPRQPEMLPYVSVPVASTIGLRPGHFGASHLGMNHNPFETAGDPNGDDFKMRNIKLQEGMSIDRREDRQGLRKQFDRMRRDMEESGAFDAMDAFQYQAFELVCGEFSRTPRMNKGHGRGTPGRDHWGNAMFCVLGGGGRERWSSHGLHGQPWRSAQGKAHHARRHPRDDLSCAWRGPTRQLS